MTDDAMQDPEAEAAVIGAVLSDNTIALRLHLDAEDFRSPVLGQVWALAVKAVESGHALTVAKAAQASPELGGYLRLLADNAPPSSTADSYAATVRETATRRRLVELTADFSTALCEQKAPPETLVGLLLADLGAALGRSGTSVGKRGAMAKAIGQIQKPGAVFKTGLPGLDNAMLGGLYAGKCYGIAARKKVGKTVLLGTMSHNLNRRGIPHLFLAAEMSPVEIEQRNLARELDVSPRRFLVRDAKTDELMREASSLTDSMPDCTVYEHCPGGSWGDVQRLIGRHVIERGIRGFFLDYWQIIGGKRPAESEEYHLRTVAQGCADYCRRQGIWGVIAAQVNQEGNTRGGEGLKLAADMYFTLHREKGETDAWLEMEESRYAPYANVGSATSPGLKLNTHGPWFQDPDEQTEQARQV